MVTDTRAPDPATAVAAGVLEKPSIDGLEEKWVERWAAEDTYAFDRAAALAVAGRSTRSTLRRRPAGRCTWGTSSATPHRPRRPLPADARRHVYYPMGWDDNGLPTERRVQNYYGALRPSLHYDPTFEPPANPGKGLPISRRNFVELRMQLTEEDERAFEQLWRRRLSVDWSNVYRTISEASRASAADVPEEPGPRRGLRAGGADPLGHHLPDRRRPGRAEDGSAPAPTTGSRLRACPAPSSSRRPGPS